jgi:hypothetical protein
MLWCFLDVPSWEGKWKMAFNVDKCNVMHITRARTTKKHPYAMHDQQLKIVAETKYLGITISNNLSWNNHRSCIAYGCFFVVLALVMCMTLHLSTLNAIFHFPSHLISLFRSFCNKTWSSRKSPEKSSQICV